MREKSLTLCFRIEFARWRLVDQVSPIIPVGLFGQAQIGFCQILKLDSQLRSSVALRLCVQFGGFYSDPSPAAIGGLPSQTTDLWQASNANPLAKVPVGRRISSPAANALYAPSKGASVYWRQAKREAEGQLLKNAPL
jgi:hypothetical protein